MFKRILLYLISFALLLLIGFYSHIIVLSAIGEYLYFSLFDIYLFHAIFSFGICTVLLTLSKLPKFSSQLGFIYLVGFLLKFFMFVAVFQEVVLNETALSIVDSVSLMVPIVLFLVLEVYFVAKLLRLIEVN